jgi:hypothetical protein
LKYREDIELLFLEIIQVLHGSIPQRECLIQKFVPSVLVLRKSTEINQSQGLPRLFYRYEILSVGKNGSLAFVIYCLSLLGLTLGHISSAVTMKVTENQALKP